MARSKRVINSPPNLAGLHGHARLGNATSNHHAPRINVSDMFSRQQLETWLQGAY